MQVDIEELKRRRDIPFAERHDLVWAWRQLPALIAEIEALRADRERLDWLSQGDIGTIEIDTDLVGIGKRIEWNVFRPPDYTGHENVRDAIDAARKERA